MYLAPKGYGGKLRKITATCENKRGDILVRIEWFSSVNPSWRPRSLFRYLRLLGFNEIDYQDIAELEIDPLIFIDIILFASKDGRNFKDYNICVQSYLPTIDEEDDTDQCELTYLVLNNMRDLVFFSSAPAKDIPFPRFGVDK